MRFGILGPLVVADDQGREVALGGPKQRAVLAILLLHPGEVVSTDRLIEELWGERASAKAAKTLHVYVSNLRKALGEGWLASRAPGYLLSTVGGEVDVDRFQTLVAQGRQALHAGDARAAVVPLRAALRLWRGPPLADLIYEQFAQGEVTRLMEARVSALEDRIDAELALGEHAALVGELESLVREHPLRERLHGQLMLALYRSGRQAEALDAYQRVRQHLSEELGLEPGPELRVLQAAILNHDATLTVIRADEPADRIEEPTAGEALGGGRRQRKVVTALLCDVQGPGELGEQLDPEVLSGVMSRCFAELHTVIEGYGGTVNRSIRDAVTAVFGIPQVREDDALRAVRAAVEISQRLPAVADELGARLRFRIGVNTGLVLVAEGEDSPVGDAVNVAAWLGQAAASGEILIGAETLRLVRDAVEVQALEPLEPKGKSGPIDAFRVLGVDRFARGVARRLDTPFVGRDRELGWLREAWLRSVQEPGCQLVTLLGAAGVGKSRLVAELTDRVGKEALVLAGRCLPYGHGITFWPLLEALASVEGAAAVLERLESGTAAIPQELFLDIRRLLESLAREQPVVLCIDDLQWAQPTLLDLIDHLVDLSRGAPILVLCLARPELLEDHPGWAGGKLRATNLLLEPLDARACENLVEQLDEELDPEARKQAVIVSEGNPLFLEELVALPREDELVMLPPTIQALLAARIERLPLEEREVLERGAVEGEVFHRSGTFALAETAPSAEVDLRLASLVRKELIRPHSPTVLGDDAFRFKHLLMRDVVYDGLPKAARAQLHERFGHWLLDESPGEGGEGEKVAGWHLEQAAHYQRELGREVNRELLVLAADQLRAAGWRARRRADVPAAITFLQRALAIAPEDDPREPVMSAELAEQLIKAGEFDRADALLCAIEGDPQGSTLAALARLEWLIHAQTNQAPEAIRSTLPGILEQLARTSDHEGLARAHLVSALWHWIQGHTDDTRSEARLAAQHASKAGDRSLREQALGWYVGALWWGSLPLSSVAQELEQIVEREQPGAFLAADIELARAELERFSGRFTEATELMHRVIDTCRALGLQDRMAGNGMWLAEAQLAAGNPVAAGETLRRSDAILADQGERGYRSTIQAWLAVTDEQLGNLDQARAAIALAETLGGPDDIINYVITEGVRARLALRDGNHDEAERWARSAVERAYTTDSTRVQANARLRLADVLATLGRCPEALEEARAASDLFVARGDEFGHRQAQALLDQLASPSATVKYSPL